MRKTRYVILGVVICLSPLYLASQNNVGIGTLQPNAKAILDLTSSTMGFLAPRMTSAERYNIQPGASEEGLLVYDTDMKQYTFWDGLQWIYVPGSLGTGVHNISLLFDSITQTLSITDGGGTLSATLTFPVDNDPDPTNELNQSLTFDNNGKIITLTDAGTVLSTAINVDDADADPTNEFNVSLILNGTTLSLTDGGGTLYADLSSLSNNATTNAWQLLGNSATNPLTHFIGTTDNAGLSFRTNNIEHMRLNVSGTLGIGTSAPPASAKVEISSVTQGILVPRMTSSQRQAINSPADGLLVYDLTASTLMQYDGNRWREVGAAPIGSIIAWHKSFSGTPSLPWGWMECNGQIVNDTESPYHGQALPNLNGTFTTEAGTTSFAGRFLRGATTSGIFSSDQTNTLRDFDYETSFNSCCSTYPIPLDGSYSQIMRHEGNPDQNHGLRMRNRGVETNPGNMTVVWIMRIK